MDFLHMQKSVISASLFHIYLLQIFTVSSENVYGVIVSLAFHQ